MEINMEDPQWIFVKWFNSDTLFLITWLNSTYSEWYNLFLSSLVLRST